MRKFLPLLLLMFPLLISCSSTSSIQANQGQYSQSRAVKGEDMPVIRGYVGVLNREVAQEGGFQTLMTQLGTAANSWSPAGVVAALGLQPASMFSDLQKGIREQVGLSWEVDAPANKNVTVTVEGRPSQSSTGGENGDSKQSGIESLKYTVKSYKAKNDTESNDGSSE